MKCLTKKYKREYGDINMLINEECIVKKDIVYDITTETGHFLCNNMLSHNCWAMTLQPIAERGLFFIDQFPTGPAKHLTTFMDHVLETVSWMSNLMSGALGLPDLFVYMYYFWQKDVKENHVLRNPEYYARQYCQKLIYDLNQPYLRITQAAFTNVSIMDREYLIGLFGGREFPDGEPVMDHIDGILQIQKWFMEELTNTRKTDHMFTYPVVTYSLLVNDGEFVDKETARWASDHNCDWMDGNFFMGTDITSLSSCCRLINNTSKLTAFINSIGGTALQVGSVKVSTINLRRIALEAYGDKDEYMRILKERVGNNLILLDVQRNIIKRNIEKGLLPNYTHGLIDIEKQFSTIGLSGLYCAVEEMGGIVVDEFGYHYYTDEGLAFAESVLDEINVIKDEWVAKRDYSVNIESIPGESCNIKMAQADALLFPNATKKEIYGNQWVPLHETCSLKEKFRLASKLDAKCGGGVILHVNVESPFSNKEQAWDTLNAMAKAGVIYSAFNARVKECAENHHWIGSNSCPICGKEVVEEYTRIVGFYRPRSSFSKERMAEYDKRTWHNNTNLDI